MSEPDGGEHAAESLRGELVTRAAEPDRFRRGPELGGSHTSFNQRRSLATRDSTRRLSSGAFFLPVVSPKPGARNSIG
jgi:hypothetical protein